VEEFGQELDVRSILLEIVPTIKHAAPQEIALTPKINGD
jgi:hypothetical protein